jgi:hypothetical protein
MGFVHVVHNSILSKIIQHVKVIYRRFIVGNHHVESQFGRGKLLIHTHFQQHRQSLISHSGYGV